MNRSLIFTAAFVSCLVSGVLWACQSPVFRYALERWKPGMWQLVVVSSGRLSRVQQEAIEEVQAAADRGLPVRLRHIDLSTATEVERSFWNPIRERSGNDRDTVFAAALYPQSSAIDQPLASMLPLNAESAGDIISSPAREELVRRLIGGHSAVWIFVDSGDQKLDAAAHARLQQQLQKEAERLKLPSASELLVTEDFLRQVRVPFKLEFSILRVRRDDMRERFLLDCLLNSEEDLRELAEPLVFPVFGRGRVLYALAGPGISAGTITDACDFLTGACSCEIKEQNPGFDLLLDADWGRAVGEKLISSPVPAEGGQPKLLAIPPGRRSGSSAEQSKR